MWMARRINSHDSRPCDGMAKQKIAIKRAHTFIIVSKRSKRVECLNCSEDAGYEFWVHSRVCIENNFLSWKTWAAFQYKAKFYLSLDFDENDPVLILTLQLNVNDISVQKSEQFGAFIQSVADWFHLYFVLSFLSMCNPETLVDLDNSGHDINIRSLQNSLVLVSALIWGQWNWMNILNFIYSHWGFGQNSDISPPVKIEYSGKFHAEFRTWAKRKGIEFDPKINLTLYTQFLGYRG